MLKWGIYKYNTGLYDKESTVFMILRIEIPKPIPKGITPTCQSIKCYLDGERLWHIHSVDFSVKKCPMRQIDDYTFEFEGEFELREMTEKNTIPNTFVIHAV